MTSDAARPSGDRRGRELVPGAGDSRLQPHDFDRPEAPLQMYSFLPGRPIARSDVRSTKLPLHASAENRSDNSYIHNLAWQFTFYFLGALMVAIRFLTILLALSAAVTSASEALDARLEKARSAFQGRMDAAVASIHRRLEAKETQARGRGDKKLVDQIKSESEAVDKSLTLPTSVDVEPQLNEIRKAKTAFLGEYDQVIRECLKAKTDDDAAKYEGEKNDFDHGFFKTYHGISGALGTLWVHPGGSFEVHSNGDWTESFNNNPRLRHSFASQNVKRMNDHVILEDPPRKCTVWIHADRCVVKLGTAEPRVFYKGEWKR